MSFRGHNPAHFHAEYGEFELIVNIETGEVVGDFPRRALKMVLEWHQLHKPELAEDWRRARDQQPLNSIEPLE